MISNNQAEIKITIIGTGNVATVIGRLLKQNNFIINEVIGRNKEHAANLAEDLCAGYSVDIKLMKDDSDVYIIAVSDSAVEKVATQLRINDKIVVHTSGSVSKNVLQNSSGNFGVLYPLQSIRKEIQYKKNIPFLIDGNNQFTKNKIKFLADSISANVGFADDEQRLHYHVSAIIVSNFTNHLFALAKKYCEENNIDFSLLLSLIEETVQRMHEYEPAETQTGPAIRGDISTIDKHLALLKNYPQLQNIYKLMSESIIAFSKK